MTAHATLPNGAPRYSIWGFPREKPTSWSIQDKLHDCWAMPRTDDYREAVAMCHVLNNPGDAPIVDVSRSDIVRQMEFGGMQ